MDHYAQKRANNLALGLTNEISIYGENILISSPFKHIGEIAVDFWYSQLRLFDKGDSEEQLDANEDISKFFILEFQ